MTNNFDLLGLQAGIVYLEGLPLAFGLHHVGVRIPLNKRRGLLTTEAELVTAGLGRGNAPIEDNTSGGTTDDTVEVVFIALEVGAGKESGAQRLPRDE